VLAAGLHICLFIQIKGSCKIVNFFVGFIVTRGEVFVVFDVQCLMLARK
jgi:hypothetical protein